MLPIFKYKKGFSLIEVVIYVALLVIILVAVTGTLLAISKTSRELVAWQSLQSEGVSIMDRLAREIREADALATGGVFDSNPGKLVLSTEGLSGGALADTTIGADANDDLYIKVGTAATTTLTSRTEVRSLFFRQINSGTVRAIRLELILGTKSGAVDKTMNLYNTIILRSSYAQ